MTPAVSEPSSPDVRPNPWRAFGGVWRLTWRRFCTPAQWLILAGSVTVLGLLSVIRVRYGRETAFLPWTAQFYLGLIVPVMAFLSGAAAIRDEMKSSTADYVLTRPVRRIHLVVFKYLSHLACSQLFYLAVLASLLGLAIAIRVPDAISTAPRLVLTQLLAVMCFNALGFLFGVISERYLVLGIVYAGTVEMAIGRIPTQLNHLSMSHQLSSLLPSLDPTGVAFLTVAGSPASVTLSLLGYTMAFMAICALIFSRRELAGAAGRST